MTPDIPNKLLSRMHSLFTSHKKLLSVTLYGPRATGESGSVETVHDENSYDERTPEDSIRLAVSGPLGSRDIRQLRHQLGELPTSIAFDLIHLDHLDDPKQKQIIADQGIEIFKRKSV